MTFDERKQIVDKFLEWESKYPVDEWLVNGMHFWPVLKINLFLSIFAEENKKRKLRKSEHGFIMKRLSRVLKYLNACRLVWFFPSRTKRVLFCGATTYRANVLPHQSKLYYNRYFDPLMDELEQRGIRASLLEYYPLKTSKVYKRQRVISLQDMLSYFSASRETSQEQVVDIRFLELLNDISAAFKIPTTILTKKINSIAKNISQWKALFGFVFGKMKPTHCLALCYYSPAMYGMILAATERRIVTVDMQHGGQGELHLAYTFNKVPATGYNTLPSLFWCWDRQSFDHLSKMPFQNKHKIYLGGNPWLDFLKEIDIGLNIPAGKPLILYTLQPLEPVINQYILDAIKLTVDKYEWWLRLHPLMDNSVKAHIHALLKENGLDERVVIDKATQYPLPSILAKTSIHISKYSGALIEAGMLGIPSIILDEIGVRTFSDLIAENKAIAVLNEDHRILIDALQSLIARKNTKGVTTEGFSYRRSLTDLLTVDAL
jgi:hypothetical protein